jgi:hypothetical protein
MKRLHRADLFGWSSFDEERNIDFHSVAWIRPEGNVLIDPLPLSRHDAAHLEGLGGARWIVVTNSDHVRDSQSLAAKTRATLVGPKAERETFPISCERWVGDGDELLPGLEIVALDGSKTPGELALILRGETVVTGDLLRVHEAGALTMLPDAKLLDKAAAIASVRRLSARVPDLEAILPGDGWPIFRHGREALEEFLARLAA